jgi:hypothetical protein
MKISLLLFLTILTHHVTGQVYANGPKFFAYKSVYADLDDNVKNTTNFKSDITIEISSTSKIILVTYPTKFFEKYYFTEYNKDILVKGKYYDMFTISQSYTSESNNSITDVLLFSKDYKNNKLISMKYYFADKGFITLYLRQ